MPGYQPSLPAGENEGRFCEGTKQSSVLNPSPVLEQGDHTSMAAAKSKHEIIAARTHEVLEIRDCQLSINLLGLYGGKPYVEARLSRFAGESRIDWEGGTRGDGTHVTGRKEQAHCVPHLGRISEKINQYVLGVEPQREGITPEVYSDITAEGQNLDAFMRDVNNYVTTCRWCWIGIDAPANPEGSPISKARKEQEKIRPYWSVYSPLQVVDWYFDGKGNLQWLITDTVDYLASDPLAKPVNQRVRRLWEPGKVTNYYYGTKPSNRRKIVRDEEVMLTLQGVVPFVPVGKIDARPYGFDSIESINRTIMDLESCNRQNFFNTVFPQRYIPDSSLMSVMDKFQVSAEAAVEMVNGYNYPVLVGEKDQPPGIIMPDAAAIGTIREELTQLRDAMFDSVGLMLQQETRQVASAESKAWDHLDIKHVMKERAGILEDAEKKAVEISAAWDSDWPAWEPQYNRDFDVSNFKEEMEAIVIAGNVPGLTPGMKQLLVERTYELVKGQGSGKVADELADQIKDELKNFEEADPLTVIDPTRIDNSINIAG